jgi:acyl-CoA thioester hydrolase
VNRTRLIRRKLLVSPRFHQIDMMGVVHNAQFFFWFEEGRLQIAAEILSMQEADRRGIAMPVVENSCRYRGSVRLGDRLALFTSHRLQETYAGRLEFSHSLVDIVTKTEVASGISVTALVDLGTGRMIRRWPEDLWERYRRLA